MKKYAFTLSMEQRFDAPVTKHSFILRCTPGTYPFQRSYAHTLTVKPYTALTVTKDVYGNEMYTGTIDKAHSAFSFSASGFVLASKYLTHDPLDRLYLYPTRDTQPTEGMRLLVQNADLPTNDWARAKTLCRKTAALMKLTDTLGCRPTPEIFASGKGNSAEIAQIFLCLCRLSGIPARFVSGLTVGIDRIHSWAEVYCGTVWRAVDPSRGIEINEGYLKIAHGPDFDAGSLDRCCFNLPGTASTRITSASVTEHVVATRDTTPHA